MVEGSKVDGWIGGIAITYSLTYSLTLLSPTITTTSRPSGPPSRSVRCLSVDIASLPPLLQQQQISWGCLVCLDGYGGVVEWRVRWRSGMIVGMGRSGEWKLGLYVFRIPVSFQLCISRCVYVYVIEVSFVHVFVVCMLCYGMFLPEWVVWMYFSIVTLC